MKKCNVCNKELDEKNFYISNNLKKYPDGLLNTCKDCICTNVYGNRVESFIWILQECDVPFVIDVYANLLYKIGKKNWSIQKTFLNIYMNWMHLHDFKGYRWKDTPLCCYLKGGNFIA